VQGRQRVHTVTRDGKSARKGGGCVAHASAAATAAAAGMARVKIPFIRPRHSPCTISDGSDASVQAPNPLTPQHCPHSMQHRAVQLQDTCQSGSGQPVETSSGSNTCRKLPGLIQSHPPPTGGQVLLLSEQCVPTPHRATALERHKCAPSTQGTTAPPAHPGDPFKTHPLAWVAECLHPRLDGVHRVHRSMLCDASHSTSQHVLQQQGREQTGVISRCVRARAAGGRAYRP
jgi:hypothetical protein